MPARSTATASACAAGCRACSGLALSVVAIVVVGPRDVARGLRAANPWLVAIAAVAVFPLLAPKARRWQIVLADFGIALPWRDAFRFYAIGLWAAIVTPGQLGDGLKAWYVQSRGGNLAPALASVVVDRLFDVLMLLAAAALGVAVYGAAFGAQFALVGVLTVVTIVGIVVAARPVVAASRRRAATRRRCARASRGCAGSARCETRTSPGRASRCALGWSLVSFARDARTHLSLFPRARYPAAARDVYRGRRPLVARGAALGQRHRHARLGADRAPRPRAYRPRDRPRRILPDPLPQSHEHRAGADRVVSRPGAAPPARVGRGERSAERARESRHERRQVGVAEHARPPR